MVLRVHWSLVAVLSLLMGSVVTSGCGGGGGSGSKADLSCVSNATSSNGNTTNFVVTCTVTDAPDADIGFELVARVRHVDGTTTTDVFCRGSLENGTGTCMVLYAIDVTTTRDIGLNGSSQPSNHAIGSFTLFDASHS
jgi:hypothetical protein